MIFDGILLERAYLQTRKNVPPHYGAKMRMRRRNALDKAYRLLETNPFIHYENGKLLLLSESRTETNEAKFYETSADECRLIEPGDFLCHAFWDGFPCWHRAALEIVERYFEILEESSLETSAKSVSIVNSLSPS